MQRLSLALWVLLITSFPLHALHQPHEPAPELMGFTLDDELFRLSQTQGVRVLNLFWVLCIPCREELPELAQLEQRYPKVSFIAIHSEEEDEEVVRDFIHKLPAAPRTVVLGNPLIKKRFHLEDAVYPLTIVLGADGRPLDILKGYTKKTVQRLKQLLEQHGR